MGIDTIPEPKSGLFRVYPVGPQDRELIDKELDQLQVEGKIQWITIPPLYGFLLSVMWRIVHASSKNSKRKDRVVIDIRGLYKKTVSDDILCRYSLTSLDEAADAYSSVS